MKAMQLPGFRMPGSVAARLGVGYGLLMATAIAAVAIVFYAGTVGVIERSIDAKIATVSQRLAAAYARGGRDALARAIDAQLHDRVDSDTEIIALLGADGHALAGNVPQWTGAPLRAGTLAARDMQRDGKPITAKVLARPLGGGLRLVVGRDLGELAAIRGVVARALLAGCAVSLLASFGGALLFRRLVESRIGRIRLTANGIAAGDMSRRIVVQGEDEFALLGRDINRMLDRIGQLMEGVRHVSNSIAHDLRTPLSRVRNRLDHALRHAGEPGALEGGARLAVDDIDNLTSLFEKLLQIAAAETGLRPASFEPVELHGIAADMAELYEAAAEDVGVTLTVEESAPVHAHGDRDLLASALASLIDNAIKYAAPGTVRVAASAAGGRVSLAVCDDGPGVPEAELDKLCDRFYRIDRSRHLPGNGLGLSIVSAIAQLHGGALELTSGAPGLRACIVLPAASAPATA